MFKTDSKITRCRGLLILVSLLPALICGRISETAEAASENVRSAAVAGAFYPADPEALSLLVDQLLAKASPAPGLGSIKALIVPHAGYQYSGPVAAEAYKTIQGSKFKKVFIIASNHADVDEAFKFSIGDFKAYQTPLGQVPVSPLVSDLIKSNLFQYIPAAHTTHIIEAQLPFLQKLLTDFEIIPIVTGRVTAEDLNKAAEEIGHLLDQESLLVVSSDLSHYHPYQDAVKIDKTCISSLEQMQIAQSCQACGLPAIALLMQIAKAAGWTAKVLDYRNSGDIAGLKDRVVGYSAIAFFAPVLTESDKALLLKLSRQTLENLFNLNVIENSVLKGGRPSLQAKRGCFVTLKKNGSLRGCIGNLLPQETLFECVMDNTKNAAFSDPRFPPLQQKELSEVKIEISVLTPPEPVKYDSSDSLLSFLQPGFHGLIIRQGLKSSTFLPQVWEQLPEKKMFLSRLCLKGGMESSCWQNNDIEVLSYQAVYFSETGALETPTAD